MHHTQNVPMPIDPFLTPERLLEVAHVAHRLSASHEYVRRLIREKKLAAIRLGSRWRVDPQDLQAFINAQRVAHDHDPSRDHRGDGPRESSVRSLPQAVNR